MSKTLMQPYHLVENSPWPFLSSMTLMTTFLGLSKLFVNSTYLLMTIGMMSTMMVSLQWWRDVNREASGGSHTLPVTTTLRLGMFFFILSEMMFFVSFFWNFFNNSLNIYMDMGNQWPPENIMSFNPYSIPFLNTCILLTSGLSVTWSHYSILSKNFNQSYYALTMTITLGLYFTFLQYLEYKEASFSISDSIYGSSFFIATGFHGVHVIIGSLMLSVMLFRLMNGMILSNHNIGLEVSIWYWHFVDVVWLFLYICIYWWGY